MSNYIDIETYKLNDFEYCGVKNSILLNSKMEQSQKENEELKKKNTELDERLRTYTCGKNHKLTCDSCDTQIIPLENRCDFCDKKMCETCQMNSYYSFHYCNECGTNYCYYNGLGDDYKCLKAKYSGHCFDCGF